jgi:hypothetical protein
MHFLPADGWSWAGVAEASGGRRAACGTANDIDRLQGDRRKA